MTSLALKEPIHAFLAAEVKVPSFQPFLHGRSFGNIGLAAGVLNEFFRSDISSLSRGKHRPDEEVEDGVENQDEKNKKGESKHLFTSLRPRTVRSFPRPDPL